jgi:hypothetical protein
MLVRVGQAGEAGRWVKPTWPTQIAISNGQRGSSGFTTCRLCAPTRQLGSVGGIADGHVGLDDRLWNTSDDQRDGLPLDDLHGRMRPRESLSVVKSPFTPRC